MVESVSRISVSIDNPYIDFAFVKATPALVLYIAYFILLAIVCCYGVAQNKLKLDFLSWNTYSKEKNSILYAQWVDS